ncbi:uncharacterized protein alms1 isoform X2 [Rhincodon typus]|uniref:uncharacterized protein alms1 isoform X2 n=1 Tax=Rhincodon typus TaxID=259920 RepID=UPI00202DF65A|nr:uncharacterized protein alms1 isoform X2 [Rhincodon typus]
MDGAEIDGNDSGSQLQAAGADIRGMTSVSVSQLLLTGAQCQQSFEEFPTIEEGTITVTEESMSMQRDFREHQPSLELQGSGLSSAPPFLNSYPSQNQEEGKLSHMIFHRSPMEFAPLRGSPNLSGVLSEGYTRAFQGNSFQEMVIPEPSADCERSSPSLSQHVLGHSSSGGSLSQHSLTLPSPRWSEATEDEDFTRAEKYIGDQRFMELPSIMPSIKSDGCQPPSSGIYRAPLSEHKLPLGGELPAPQVLEEAVEMAGSSGSRRAAELIGPLIDNQRSSLVAAEAVKHGITALEKEWEPNATEQPPLNPESALDSRECSSPEHAVPHEQPTLPDPSTACPNPLGNGNLAASDPGRPEVSHTLLCSQGRQVSKTSQTTCSEAGLERQPTPSSLSAPSNGFTSGAGPVTACMEPTTSSSGKVDTVIEVKATRSTDSKSDGTALSGYSIEREQKDSELSPTVCPANVTDSSFLASLADPVCQSTPAVPLNASAKGLAQLGQARRVASRLLEGQAPAAGISKVSVEPSFGKKDLTKASQNTAASSTRQACPGVLQSMPPLSYMEKVGAWDMHCCPGGKPNFDSLVLHGIRGVSPRQQAYSAIADSLNDILSRINGAPASSSPPKRRIAATFGIAHLQTDHQQSTQRTGQSTSRLSDTGSDHPVRPVSPAGLRRMSQPVVRRGSLDDAPLGKADSSHCHLNRDRAAGIHSLESISTLAQCLSSHHDGASPSMLEARLSPVTTEQRESSSSGQTATSPGHGAASPGPHPSSATVCPERFSAASPQDELNLLGSSQESSRAGVSGHSLTSLEVDNYVPIWTPSRLTPDANQFNVEDRIPIYLHNLGINQSPSSILGSRGPSRQVDFTLMELKKERESEATKGLQDAEGLSALDPVSCCNFSSDGLTHSTSIPVHSDRGPDTLISTEQSPGAAREVVTDPGGSRCSSLHPPTSRRLDFSNQHPALVMPVLEDSARGENLTSLQKAPPSPSSESVSRRVERLLSEFESAPDAVVRDPAPFSPSHSGGELPAVSPTEAGVQMIREGAGPIPPPTESRTLPCPYRDHLPWREDQSIGLKTLREIRELLGDTAVSVTSQQGSLSAEVPAERPGSNEHEAVTLLNVGDGEFLSQWATTVPQSKSPLGEGPGTGLGKVHKTPATVWHTSSITERLSEKGECEELLGRRAVTAGGERLTQPASTSHAGRAEPEGCSGVTAGSSGTVPSGQGSGSSLTPNTLTTPEQAAPSATPQLPSQPWALIKDSRTGGGQEEDNTTDPLAARVAKLLQGQRSTRQESHSTRAGNKQKDGAQDWEQKKPLMQPPDPLSILDEEDRRRIEEIKAELLQASKNLIHSEDGCSVDAEDFSLLSDQASSLDTGLEVELPTLPSAEFRSVNVAQCQISSQLQKLSDNQFDTTVRLRTPLCRDMDEQLKAVALDCPVSECVESLPSQPAKPIIAITFSSRRKTLPTNSQLSTPLPKVRATQKHGAIEPLDEDSPSLDGPSRYPINVSLQSDPTFGEIQGECQQSDLEQRKPNVGESSVVEQPPLESEVPSHGSPAALKPICSSPDPHSSSPNRTVLSHIRVTLSPKQPASSKPLLSDIPVPSQHLHLCPADPPATGDGPHSALCPPNRDASDRSCPTAWQPDPHGPPYPPLPMPIPPFYPTFLPLFDYPSEIRPELRIQTAQDSNKVDVSTQTIAPPPLEAPIIAVPTSETGEQEVSVPTLPDLGSAMTTGHTLVTPGTDVPVMLPYKPAGSTKLFYMPKSGAQRQTAQLDSESSSESLRTDSLHASPTRVLTEDPEVRSYCQSRKLMKHRERMSSKAAAPKKPREEEEKMRLFERGIRRCQSTLIPGAAALPPRMLLQDAGDGDISTSGPLQHNLRNSLESWTSHSLRYPETRRRTSQRELSSRGSRSYPAIRPALGHREDEWRHSVPSCEEWTEVAARRPRQDNSRSQLCHDGDVADHVSCRAEGSQGQPSAREAAKYSSLDELWQKFKDRHEQYKSLASSSASELSLLERLDELARMLKNPAHHSLLTAEGRAGPRRMGESERRHTDWENPARDLSDFAACSLAPTQVDRPDSLEEISTERIKKILDHRQCGGLQSGSLAAASTTESDTAVPAETEPQTQTETGSTVSTIDTDRLIRAFGPERVTVQPLSRLYGTIERQKESLTQRRGKLRRAESRCRSVPVDQHVSTSTSDALSADSPSAPLPRGPSSKLINKKCTRLVNQGVQTESLESDPSMTERQTRDVGVTYPSPDSNPTLHRPATVGSHRHHSACPTARCSSSARDRKKSTSHTERRPGKAGRTSAGPAWFIPAAELKWSSRKENVPGQCLSPPPSQFDLSPSSSSWREPLREKHLQQQWASETVNGWSLKPAAKNPSPLIRLTLKEALHMNRPDFISHSRQRVRRLELLTEERKIQSILQSERERLFNQPQERGRRSRKGCALADAILLKKKIPKREMFDRSKRLYEQLPEVIRRREEEKRRAEYQTNRLKAQLYKQKITNHVLGRKVSWQ